MHTSIESMSFVSRRHLITMLAGCLGALAAAPAAHAQLSTGQNYRVEVVPTDGSAMPPTKLWLVNRAGRASQAVEVQGASPIAWIKVGGDFGPVAKLVLWPARSGKFSGRIDADEASLVFGPGPAGPVGPTWLTDAGGVPFAGCCSDCSDPNHCKDCHETTFLESIFGCVPGTVSCDCPITSNGTYNCSKD
jgi:hypothetical protein